MSRRGYVGLGIYDYKTDENVGTLMRSANCFNVDFLFTIKRRYSHQRGDTMKTPNHIPLFHFESLEEFQERKPFNCTTVCVELDEKARSLYCYIHPIRAAYLLGREDSGLPKEYMEGKQVVQIPNLKTSLNVAVTGSILLYDRMFKNVLK